MDESYSSEQAQALQSTVASIPNVSDAAFVDRAVAMDTFMNNFDSDFRDGIDETVFRHRFVIHLNDISLMSQTEAELENVEGIVKVKAHLEYANAFITIRNIVSVVSLVLTVILVFVSMFIMSNTIKLATFGRREEIAIMKMVGATNSFIRLPFIIEGLVLGVLGGGLAFLAEWGLYSLLASRLMGTLVGSFISVIPFTEVAIPMLIAYLGMSVFVGVFGGVNAIRNYLKV